MRYNKYNILITNKEAEEVTLAQTYTTRKFRAKTASALFGFGWGNYALFGRYEHLMT